MLQSQDTAPLVQVGGAELDISKGEILLTDLSEANVKRYDLNGQLRGIIGRRGNGPGELISPRYPRRARSGEIYVAETNGKISVFDSGGTFTRALQIQGGFQLQGFEVTSSGAVWALVDSVATALLLEIDAVGGIRRSVAVSSLGALLKGDPDVGPFRKFSMTTRGDTVFVVSSLVDSVWQVEGTSLHVTSHKLDTDEYVAPSSQRIQDHLIDGRLDFMGWARTFDLAVLVVATPSALLTPFTRGVYMQGNGRFVSFYQPEGSQAVVSTQDSLAILAADDDALLLFDATDPAAVALRLAHVRTVSPQ